jgi:phenylalanine-4-hydroxylase
LRPIFKKLQSNYPNDWLLSLEIAELLKKNKDSKLLQEVLNHLEKLKVKRPEIAHLITDGLELIFEN